MALPIQIAQFGQLVGGEDALDGSGIGNLYNKHGYASGEHGHCGDRYDGPSQA